MNRSNQLKIRKKILFTLIGVFIYLFLLLTWILWEFFNWLENRFVGNQEQNSRKEICKETILEALKSPWTAIFWEKRVYGNQYIKNYVDSQNSYWALLRNYFLCGDVRSDGSVIFFFEDEPAYNTLDKLEFGSN